MKDVIIAGMGDSVSECPFDAEEIWGINFIGSQERFKDKHFDKIFVFDWWWDENWLKEMRAVAPIVSWQPYADIKYPLDEIVSYFKTKYFSNTVCYMIAYAIYLKIPKIRFYGIDGGFGMRYELDKSAVEYWISKIEDYGLEYELSKGSSLLKTPTGHLYGEKIEGGVVLPLGERNMFVNMLPSFASYKEGKMIATLKQMLSPTEQEVRKYGIEFLFTPDGKVVFQTPIPFSAEVWLPEEVWKYLSLLLDNSEKQGKLPIDAIRFYERLVLSPTGGDGLKPHEVKA